MNIDPVAVRGQRLDLRFHIQARKEPRVSRLWWGDGRAQGQEGDKGRGFHRHVDGESEIVRTKNGSSRSPATLHPLMNGLFTYFQPNQETFRILRRWQTSFLASPTTIL